MNAPLIHGLTNMHSKLGTYTYIYAQYTCTMHVDILTFCFVLYLQFLGCESERRIYFKKCFLHVATIFLGGDDDDVIIGVEVFSLMMMVVAVVVV